MKQITLVKNGVFPITHDENGDILSDRPKTELSIAGTIQGEGKLAGVPSLFVRTAGCNLRCMWSLDDGNVSPCDTWNSSFDIQGAETIDVDKVVNLLRENKNNIQHLVITGGEPMLQTYPLITLCRQIKEEQGLHITLETNATIFNEELAQYIDLFSLSPKLKNSIPTQAKSSRLGLELNSQQERHAILYRQIEVIQQFIDYSNTHQKDIQIKFVVGNSDDEHEINNEFLKELSDWKSEDILIMNLGGNTEEIGQSVSPAIEMSIRNGWRYTPRLHIDLFGNKEGV
ncbi:7-carboxy-7-deazaguanine synthase QueE [Puteibacter caeruleilacunae]|nr:7-carboxy-7-deazaguanine synthase QueE [Puteibacter caeruleilacunae]